MAIHLIVAEHDGKKIKKATLSAITAAKKISGECFALVLSDDSDVFAKDLSRYVDKVYFAEYNSLEKILAQQYSIIISDLAKKIKATHIWSGATVVGKDIMPRVAIRLDAGLASDIQDVVDDSTFKRPMWAGDIIATVKLIGSIKVVTVRATEFKIAEKINSKICIEKINIEKFNKTKMRFVSFDEVKSERPKLSDANVVVSGGRGIKGKEGFKSIIEPLASKLNAAIGASRAVCDAGWAPNDWQVGQTGKIVAPDLYIAIGISGAIQHVAGMKGSKVIVAINKDPEAPIFKTADYGLIADAFDVVPKFINALN